MEGVPRVVSYRKLIHLGVVSGLLAVAPLLLSTRAVADVEGQTTVEGIDGQGAVCLGPEWCALYGTTIDSGNARVVHLTGAELSQTGSVNIRNLDPEDMACRTADYCVVVGSSTSTEFAVHMAAAIVDSTTVTKRFWSSRSGFFESVECPPTGKSCIAVGYDRASRGIIQWIRGAEIVRTVKLPHFAAQDISCSPNEDWCMVVGNNMAIGGTAKRVVIHRGTVGPVRPFGTARWLRDYASPQVSCRSAGHCVLLKPPTEAGSYSRIFWFDSGEITKVIRVDAYNHPLGAITSLTCADSNCVVLGSTTDYADGPTEQYYAYLNQRRLGASSLITQPSFYGAARVPADSRYLLAGGDGTNGQYGFLPAN